MRSITKNDKYTNPRPTLFASSPASSPPNCVMPAKEAPPTIINSKGARAIRASGGEPFQRRHKPIAAAKTAQLRSGDLSARTRASTCGRCSAAQRATVATAATIRTLMANAHMMAAGVLQAFKLEASSAARDHASGHGRPRLPVYFLTCSSPAGMQSGALQPGLQKSPPWVVGLCLRREG